MAPALKQSFRKKALAVLRILFFAVYLLFLAGLLLFARSYKMSRIAQPAPPVSLPQIEEPLPITSAEEPPLEEAPALIPQPEVLPPDPALENPEKTVSVETEEPMNLLSPLEPPAESPSEMSATPVETVVSQPLPQTEAQPAFENSQEPHEAQSL